MRAALNLAGAAIWFALQVIVITRLLRGGWRRFPLIFVFVITEFLVAVAQSPTMWAISFHRTPDSAEWRVLLYERGEVLLEFFTFVVVISLIFRASAHLQSRRPMRVGCVLGAILFVGISFWAHYVPHTTVGLWMTPWTRDLNVGTTILDLALWFLLLTQRRKDGCLLLLSGALGIRFTGSAIGHSLRSLASQQHPWPSLLGGRLVVIAGLIQVYMWARAFRPEPQTAPKSFALDAPSEP
jgi:hypothetical protein